jgi:hypothetical protein
MGEIKAVNFITLLSVKKTEWRPFVYGAPDR